MFLKLYANFFNKMDEFMLVDMNFWKYKIIFHYEAIWKQENDNDNEP